MTATLLGPIVSCQISAKSLIRDGRYVHTDIIGADELHLSADGVVGWCAGRAVLNHHHRLHPHRLVNNPARLLSIGFTGHYDAMADRFGSAPIGCAAENIIVRCDRIVTEDELAAGLEIRTSDGETVAGLEPAAVAKPCVSFTKFLLGNQEATDDEVAPNRAFLDNGMRGFVLGLANQTGSEPVTVTPGLQVWALG